MPQIYFVNGIIAFGNAVSEKHAHCETTNALMPPVYHAPMTTRHSHDTNTKRR